MIKGYYYARMRLFPRTLLTGFRFASPSPLRALVVLCVFLGLLWTARARTPAPAATLHQAQELVDHGRLDEALKQLDALSAEQPEPPGVQFLRGMVLYQQEKLEDAATAFGKAVAQDPANLDAMQMQGVSLFRTGKSAAAIPLLEQARRSVPKANIDPNYVLGLCYMDTRRYDDARRAFAGQYGFAPDSGPAYLLAARMLLRRDYVPIAEEAARRAMALSPTLPQAHFLLGEIELSRGQTADAIADFQNELKLNPIDGAVYERLGDAYIHTGDFAQAEQSLDRAILLEPNANTPYILLGKVLLKRQNSIMAKMYLEHALQIDPRNYMAHFLLGQSYRALGRTEDAAREYQTAQQIQDASAPHLESPK
jgi:tetratricopeptide (TPR) repeat protein